MSLVKLLKTFIWKNSLQIRSQWVSYLLIFLCSLTLITIFLNSTNTVLKKFAPSIETKDLDLLKEYFPGNDNDLILYTTNAEEGSEIIEKIRHDLEIVPGRIKKFHDAAEMNLFMDRNCEENCFSINFKYITKMNSSKEMEYTLVSSAVDISTDRIYENDEQVNEDTDDEYLISGYFTLQALIEKHYVEGQTQREVPKFGISLIPSTELTYMDSQRLVVFGTLFNVLLNLILLSTFLIPLVEEKQSGLKEFLSISTPFSSMNGLSFILIRFLIYLIFLIIVLIGAKAFKAIGLVPLPYILILFVLNIVAGMTFTYLISLCFNSVFYAKVGGIVLLMLPNLFSTFKGLLSSISTYIFYTKAFTEALMTFQIFTNKHIEFSISDMNRLATKQSYDITSIFFILLVQSIFHCCLYVYLSSVFPGLGGQKKDYLYFLKPSFYRKRPMNDYSMEMFDDNAIIIKNLVKRFKTSTREIKISDNLDMTIKDKRITVLLGHNGAGKTTTLNMILGIVQKDSGKIIVCSERDVESYRHLIGFCPQHNIFLSYMTCKEHIIFFSLLRGYPKNKTDKLAKDILDILNLSDKENEKGRFLSGGMKRRLSVGVALAGETKVIVLDEPSSGLDIESRRELWDVLLKLRKTKAILITTHHMEEAEILGDNVCILSNGRLVKCGSPLELKRSCGSGYILKLAIRSEKRLPEKILEFIQKTIPSASILAFVEPTILINLPYEERKIYSDLLKKLHECKFDLGIVTMSITDTSLDDVFLSTAQEDFDVIDSPQVSVNEDLRIPYSRLDSCEKTSCTQQFTAIYYKKITYLINDWVFTLVMILITLMAVTIPIYLMGSITNINQATVKTLDLSIYDKGIIYLYQNEDNSFILMEALRKEIEKYRHIEVKTLKVNKDFDVNRNLQDLQNSNLPVFLETVIGAFDLREEDMCNIYYSSNIYHSKVILYNLYSNALLEASSGEEREPIHISYMPGKKTINSISASRLQYYPLIAPCGLFFYMFFFIKLPFLENESGFKNLQCIPTSIYWLANLSFDSMMHFLVCLVLFTYQRIIMPTGLYNYKEQLFIMFIMVFYGLSYLPILYSFANSFRSISTISTYLLLMFIISSILTTVTSHNVFTMQNYSTTIALFSLLPDFNLNHHLRVLNENFIESRRNKALHNTLSDSFVLHKNNNIPSQSSFFLYVLFDLISSMAVLILVVENQYVIEKIKNFFSCFACKQMNTICIDQSIKNDHDHGDAEDADVVDSCGFVAPSEIEMTNNAENYPLLVKSLYKRFGHNRFVVNNLNFLVNKGECFGLLGVNGAGKTTTFEMIAANIPITAGSIRIQGFDIIKNSRKYRYRFGYCPQYDALNFFLTAQQILRYMGDLRGLEGQELDNEVSYWLKELEMDKYKDVQIRYYSGGMKRKLNSALAMIGRPPLVLLDEPTTGVDPVSRRLLWKCVKSIQKKGRTVVFTSHSMDECEQLCNRLAIMANGQFKCLGSVQALKDEHKNGFTITLKIKDSTKASDTNLVINHLLERFPNSSLREHHANTFTFSVSSHRHVLWHKVFHEMEELTQIYNQFIEDYSINESKLEDLILNFKRNNEQNHQIVV